MCHWHLGNPYVLTEEGVDDLIALEAEPAPPIVSPGFVSRAATPERLAELNDLAVRSRES